MRKVVKALAAIGRFVNGVIKGMAEDRAGGGIGASQDEDAPPDWAQKDLGI